MRRYGFAIAASCVLAISCTNSSQAFPTSTRPGAATASISDPVTNVRYYGAGYRGRSYGRAAGYGARYYGQGYRGRYYGHGGHYYGYYGYGYGAAAAAGVILGAATVNGGYYYGAAPGYYGGRGCWIETDTRGYGYYGPCY